MEEINHVQDASELMSTTAKPSQTSPYPLIDPQCNLPEIEERTLAYWKEHRIFERSVEDGPLQEGKRGEFVFYDGPPFANGLPHYGHLLTGYIKDIIPRYRTMRGDRVERRFGWDCHGLPAEMEAEKELKVSGRTAIEEFGIEKFNDFCKDSVLKYTREWETFVSRQARWVDFENDYKTLDRDYMESVLWAFKQLWNKGLVYEGYKVVPYSWACETPLSNFETRQDNSYRSKQDPALSVKLKLCGEDSTTFLVIWTTTPWTLPSNLAVAVGVDLEYSVVEHDGERLILASDCVGRYAAELGEALVVKTMQGADLVGRSYEPLFPYFAQMVEQGCFKVLGADFVSAEDGTGLVHMAPGFGEDDQRVCQEHGIPVVCPVDNGGRFTAAVSDFQGVQVFEANKPIIQRLKSDGLVLRHETIQHNYPHCWRTDTPLIYKAVSSWYVAVSQFKSRMVELNQEIRWVPDHIRDGQFGRWLENARDWAISRTRFWGAPIPVWQSDSDEYPRTDVYGSIEELERDFGVKVSDLHRPFIDELVRPNPDDPSGKSMMRRVPDVFDCWFESGAMPFAQVHYPFENREWFETNFPADFIVEYVAQTRGWFYTLMVLSTALFDRPPFRNCICHGVVLDENGKKLSKRLRNYPSPEEVFNSLGADALRWYLVASPIVRGGDLLIDSQGKGISEVVRTAINPIWNAYYFFCLYANADGVQAMLKTDSPSVLDRYILSKTRRLIESVQSALDRYDLAEACAGILSFFQALNNWYIRRSRDRFWKAHKDADKVHAYNTLYVVLVSLTKVTAPFLPLLSEEVFRGLTNKESVHLESWPDFSEFPDEEDLVDAMDEIREICSLGLSLRDSVGIRTRQPLAKLTVAGILTRDWKVYIDLIKEELNVKQVQVESSFDDFAEKTLRVDSRKVGPRVGKQMKSILAAARAGDWEERDDGTLLVAQTVLEPGEFEVGLQARQGVTAAGLPSNRAVLVLDTTITEELEHEGYARDVVRAVQQARKDAGLHISDHIQLVVGETSSWRTKLEPFASYISQQTLADTVEFASSIEEGFHKTLVEVGSSSLEIGFAKV